LTKLTNKRKVNIRNTNLNSNKQTNNEQTLCIVFLLLIFSSCKNETEANRLKAVELELREKELNLKERELNFNEKQSQELKIESKKPLNNLFEENRESIF